MQEEKILLSKISIQDKKDVLDAINYFKQKYKNENKSHPFNVAIAVAERDLGKEAIIAALLHEIVYNKKATLDEIEKNFSEETARMVKEATLIHEILTNNYKKISPEILSPLILSIATDLRTILIRMLAIIDVLKNGVHNIEKEKLIFIATEIYSPLAIKLGVNGIDWQLQDYAFKTEKRREYEEIKKLIGKTRAERELFIEEVIKELKQTLEKKVRVTIVGRPKNFKSIYEKMKKTPFKKMHDIYGIRIICNKEKECYEILGEIHSKYDFIREAFDDYIAKEAKGIGQKGYKSIHTAIRRKEDVIEIQIRTWEQHMRTESSLYWEYKRLKKTKEFEKELSWERQLVEWQKSIGNENKVRKISTTKIFVFTPKKEIIVLPIGSTTIDFAFAVHTDVGKRIKQVRVNGTLVPIETKLNNLDKVEIILDEKTTAKKNWINYVITEKAKTKIKGFFGLASPKIKKMQQKSELIKKIKLAECCHPLPGEDVIGVKTTKRKIIIHKKDCINLKNISQDKLIAIDFEKEKGKTKIRVIAVDRIGLLAEILMEIKKSKVNLTGTNFKIKNTGYIEAIFEIEVNNVKKIDSLKEKIEAIPSIQQVIRE